jgi:hypothetical protein
MHGSTKPKVDEMLQSAQCTHSKSQLWGSSAERSPAGYVSNNSGVAIVPIDPGSSAAVAERSPAQRSGAKAVSHLASTL